MMQVFFIAALFFAGCDSAVKEEAEAPKVEAKLIKVKIATNMGDIIVELNHKAAPITVANFLVYVNNGDYDGTIFHRVIDNFMIQGGGHEPDMTRRPQRPPIKNESDNGLTHERGTITMARSNDLDSATNQFTINHVANPRLNHDGPYGGYAVFGKVIDGMDVVDAIAKVETADRADMDGRMYKDVPVKPVVIQSISVLDY